MGLFISIEGLEGVGKTTQAQVLCQWLISKGHSVTRTREPGGTPIAEQIRELLLAKTDEQLDATAELLLVFAARKQHVESLIRPALLNGQTVVSDRFTDATYAYQGAGRGLSLEQISALETQALADFKPDLTLWLDCDPVIGLERARGRGELDRFEQEDIAFFNRARLGYQQRFESDPDRFIKLDASHNIDTVSELLIQAMESRFG